MLGLVVPLETDDNLSMEAIGDYKYVQGFAVSSPHPYTRSDGELSPPPPFPIPVHVNCFDSSIANDGGSIGGRSGFAGRPPGTEFCYVFVLCACGQAVSSFTTRNKTPKVQ